MTQKERVVRFMEDFGCIDSRTAMLELGIIDLPKQISVLRREGKVIIGETKHGRNRYGETTTYKSYYFPKEH